MKLIQINKHNLPQYSFILPATLLHYPCEIFVCVKDEIACGAIALEQMGTHLGIIWFWVAPEKRKMKLGSALLAKAYQFAKQNQYTALTIAYNPNESWAFILEYMLSQMGFHLLMSPFTKYYVSAKALLSSPLMRNFNLSKNQPTRTQPLANLSTKDFAMLQLQCKNDSNPLLNHINFSNAVPQKTRLFYHENRLKGLTLINFSNSPGEYELAMVYINPAYNTFGPTLFRETALELLKDANSFSALRFTCVSNTAVRLADVLLGETEKTVEQMCHGILKIPVYNKERSNHYET